MTRHLTMTVGNLTYTCDQCGAQIVMSHEYAKGLTLPDGWTSRNNVRKHFDDGAYLQPATWCSKEHELAFDSRNAQALETQRASELAETRLRFGRALELFYSADNELLYAVPDFETLAEAERFAEKLRAVLGWTHVDTGF